MRVTLKDDHAHAVCARVNVLMWDTSSAMSTEGDPMTSQWGMRVTPREGVRLSQETSLSHKHIDAARPGPIRHPYGRKLELALAHRGGPGQTGKVERVELGNHAGT